MYRVFCTMVLIWMSSLLWHKMLGQVANPDLAMTNSQSNNVTYYVDIANGNDDNPGTEAQPWRTIQQAANVVIAGDTVYVKEGTYPEKVILSTSGREDRIITFAAYPGHTVTIDAAGQSMDPSQGVLTLDQVSHIKISGFRLLNSAQVGVIVRQSNDIIIQNNYTYNTYSSGIRIRLSQKVTVENNEVENCVNNGDQECITVSESSEVQVLGNEVHHDGAGDLGGEGIDIKHGSFDVLVKGNYVHDMEKVCIYVDSWDAYTYNITIDGNRVHDCKNSGITLASERGGLLENVTIQNNISYHNVQLGLTVADWDEGYPHPMRNIKIINNTFYNNGWLWGGGIEIANPQIENLIVRNNIVSQNNAFQILDHVGEPEVIIDYNLINGFKGSEAEETRGTNYVEGDPRFVNPIANNFLLRSNSPAIDRGTGSGAPTRDYDDHFRPVNEDWDIGAFEYRDYVFDVFVYLPLIVKP